MEALERANEIRVRRAQWKRDVKRRVGDPIEPLTRSADAGRRQYEGAAPDTYDSMKVIDYLIALPKVGRVKANKILWQTRISPSKTLGGMSQRQRDELLSLAGPYVRAGRLNR